MYGTHRRLIGTVPILYESEQRDALATRLRETGPAYGTIIWPQTRPVCGRSLRPDANYQYILTVQNNDEADPFLEKRHFVVILYE